MDFSISKFLGITNELPLSDDEVRLLTQLQANRKVALYRQIPDKMMTEFMTDIYHNRQLRSIIKKIYHTKLVNDKPSLRGIYLEDLIRLSLTKNRFSTRLIIYHGIDPKIVASIILENIKLE